VDDNLGDIDLIKVALRRSRIAKPRSDCAGMAPEALAVLHHEEPLADRPPARLDPAGP